MFDMRWLWVIGDAGSHQYCFIEFEDAAPSSIFKQGVEDDARVVDAVRARM